MKKIIALFLLAVICMSFCSCYEDNTSHNSIVDTNQNQGFSIDNEEASSNQYDTPYKKENNYNSYSSFTNKFGTPDTQCAYPGCNRNIASSGDTNCCPAHSNRCKECGCYIDSDAMYCLDCIFSAANGY